MRFEDWLLHRKRTEKAAEALVAALPDKAVTSPVVSVLRSEEGKFHWSEQEVQTMQLPKLKNDSLLGPWTVTLASSLVTEGRGPRAASVSAARQEDPTDFPVD